MYEVTSFMYVCLFYFNVRKSGLRKVCDYLTKEFLHLRITGNSELQTLMMLLLHDGKVFLILHIRNRVDWNPRWNGLHLPIQVQWLSQHTQDEQAGSDVLIYDFCLAILPFASIRKTEDKSKQMHEMYFHSEIPTILVSAWCMLVDCIFPTNISFWSEQETYWKMLWDKVNSNSLFSSLP